MQASEEARPHIFGMTASPVDTKRGNEGSLLCLFDELERSLNAQVHV